MDHHKLYKANSITLKNKRPLNEKENVKRREKRNSIFAKNRNINSLLTSTPLPTKKLNRNEVEGTENIDPKASKKEVYLKKFIDFKKSKQRELKEKKTETKPPFMPYGKLTKIEEATQSFAPQNHVFQFKKRESIYVAEPTPTKRPKYDSISKIPITPPMPIKVTNTNTQCLTAEKKKTENKKINIPAGLKLLPSTNQNIPPVKETHTNTQIFNEEKKKIENKKIHTPSNLKLVQSTSTKRTVPPAKEAHTNTQSLNEEKKKLENKKIHTAANFKLVQSTSAKQTVRPIKELPQFKKAKITAPSTGAVAKAKALINKNIPVPKKPERAKLAISLKSKNKILTSNISKKTIQTKAQHMNEVLTPLELCHPDQNFKFITSTKQKSMETRTEFSELYKTISPIPTEKSTLKNAVKPTQNNASGRRKFNFVIRHELEVTTDGTLLAENNDKTLKNKTRDRQSINKILETPETEKTLVPNSNQSLNSKPVPIDILQKPLLVNNDIHQIQERSKKFNFLKTINLNETSNESPQLPMEPKSPSVDTPKRLSRSRKTLDYTITEENSKIDETLKKNDEDKTSATPERPCNYLSSFVTCSRGKVSAQKEREKRNSIYLPGTPTKTTKDETLTQIETPIEKRRAREAVIYYRKQLNNEIERLHGLCDNWQIYKNENIELLQQSGGDDMIDVTVGQARLLTSKKFMQFKGLIDRCEASANGTAPEDDGSEKTKIITPIDLEGFWAMLGLQVDNIDKRFENLERWKSNEWQDPEAEQKLQPKIKTLKHSMKTKTNIATKVKPNAGLVQKMREMRAAMRTKIAEETNEAKNEKQKEIVENIITYCSPRRLRRSTNLNNSKCLVPIILPNRRSSSIARTVILIPSPITRLSKSPKSPSKLPNNNKRYRRSKSGKFLTPIIQKESSATIERTPSPINRAEYKPILKTPGTARSQPRNVSFNALCSVQKFRKFGKHLEATEYDEVQQIHIDELKSKLLNDTAFSSPVSSDDTDAEQTRIYRLRNRKVKLRPSSEIELPRKE